MESVRRPLEQLEDVEIGGFLRSLGFAGHEATTRAALEASGLTNPRKSRMSRAKVGAAGTLLRHAFALSCADPRCVAATRSARPNATILSVADAASCERCAGSTNDRSARGFLDSCREAGIRRLVVVGGSPATRTDLLGSIGAGLELRLIDGTSRRTLDQARADLDWADLVLIWGNTQLDHRLSALYTGPSANRVKVVGTARRGVAALLDAGTEHCRRDAPGH